MRLVTYSHPALGARSRAGVQQGDRLLDAARLLDQSVPMTMLQLLDGGPEMLESLRTAAEKFARDHRDAVHLPREIAVPDWESRVHPPLPEPRSIRDFYAFEQHVAAGYTKRGRSIPPAWYEHPVFYYAHAGNILGPDETLAKPAETSELDFELELAAIIGKPGRDIAPEAAWEHVAGLTIMNDWSARDIQRQEMTVGLGPAKGKDFATSVGPAIVTLDEVASRRDGDRIELTMIARINGEEVGRDSSGAMHWSFPALIARASRGVTLQPGDVIGSGTCGSGCLLELGSEVHPFLEPGDEVELEIEILGRLRTTVGE
jgi:fumarylacetoacetate (FAA) hydrolase